MRVVAEQERPTATELVRRRSTQAVLEALWQPGSVTASDVMRATALSRATVHDVCADLIRRGWVTELRGERRLGDAARGRRARRYGVRTDAGIVVGLHLSPARCRVVVLDLLGAVRGSAERPVGAADWSDEVLAAVDDALAAAGSPASSVLSCCVALPGGTSMSGRSAQDDDHGAELVEAGLLEVLTSHVSGPVLVERDTDAAAHAEGRLGAARGKDHFIAVLIEGGVRAGVVAAGAPVRGHRGRGGALSGRVLVADPASSPLTDGSGESEATTGRTGYCSRTDEDGASRGDEASFVDRLVTAGLEDEEVEAPFPDGSAGGARPVDESGEHLARVIAISAGIFDPEVVVLSGPSAAQLTSVLPIVRAALPPLLGDVVPEVVASGLGDDVVALGNALKALDHVREGAVTSQARLPAGQDQNRGSTPPR